MRVAGGKLANLLGDGVNESSVEVLLCADTCGRGNTRRDSLFFVFCLFFLLAMQFE